MDERDLTELRFGEELLQHRLLTEAQLKTVLEYRESLGGRVQDVVLKLGFVDEEDLSRFLARREHVPSIDLDRMPIDRKLMAQIPRKIIDEHQALPFRLAEDLVLLVTSEPYDMQVIEDVQFLTNCRVEIGLAPRSLLREKINRYYAHEDNAEQLAKSSERPLPASSALEEVLERSFLGASDLDRGLAKTVAKPDLAARLIAKIEDPTVAALARALLARGVIDADVWDRELNE